MIYRMTNHDPESSVADPHQVERSWTGDLAEQQELVPPAASAQPTESEYYTRQMVRRYLYAGDEMDELYRAAFVGSSWPAADLQSATGVRTYPARFGLLSTKWDMDIAIGELEEFERAVLQLHFWAHYSQAQIAALLGCLRREVWYTVQRLPDRLAAILNPEVSPDGSGDLL